MQRRAAGPRTTARRRIRTGRPGGVTAWTAALALSAGLLAPAPAHAEPKPTRKQLTAQQEKLADEAEKLSEQYNGLRERLKQAEHAAKTAKSSALRQQKALDEARERMAKIAADSYKNGPADPAISFATSSDPQAVLDQSATLNYFAKQNDIRITQMLQVMQGADRSRKAAERRAAQVRALTGEAKKKRRELQVKLKKVEKQLGTFKTAGGRPGSIPNLSQLKPGDLVFFHSDLHHMGMYIGNGNMVHAPQTGDVVKIAPIAGRPSPAESASPSEIGSASGPRRPPLGRRGRHSADHAWTQDACRCNRRPLRLW
ncbi:NlpC/P60 family protein [Spirillospora sp. CA-108201]